MDIKKLQALVVDALEDIKAQDIRVFDTTQLTSLFDRLAVASGTSNRQTKALAASVRDKVKENGGTILSMEGEETGEWVLVDLGDMIVHIMQPAIRDYYRLEEIWGEKEIKLGAAKRTSKRAGAAAEDEAPKKRSRHLAASQAAAEETPKKTPARKTATGAAKTAGKTAAKTASKTAAKTTRAPRKTAATATAAKTAAPRKTAAKTAAKTTAGSSVKVKVATRKAPAKKSPAKKAG